jgi:putative ABC transport system substrate-binding protein
MKTLVANVFLFLSLVVAAVPAGAENIAVVMSSDAPAYNEALKGFRETTQHRIVSVQTLKSDASTWRGEVQKLRSVVEPDLVFVIGTSALQAIAGEITNIPVVHAMVFNPLSVSSAAGKNIIGISMNPSAAQVISLIRELNPKYRRIGTMVDPSRSGPLFFQARSVFQKEGFQLVSREIRSASEIGGALKSFENEIDVLWLWPDEQFLTEEILQRIFLFSFERKIPVLGLSERHNDMGALVSLSYNSVKDMGRQAGELANRLFEAGKPTVVPHITQLKLTVNFKTARKFGVKIPDSIVNRTDNVVKAPVYRDGDWWIFLAGGDQPGTPSFLPFASVYLKDPQRQWLHFPLTSGKMWSFHYLRRNLVGKTYPGTSAYATAEVVGEAAELIQTQAGTFKTIQINRTDALNGVAYLTYFYSPRAKSVVKLKAEAITSVVSPPTRRLYELELIAYGNAASMAKETR